jgi:hypothetical protein
MNLSAIMPQAIVWFGALCTLGLYSILYRENRVFRFFEHLFIGLATGYTIYTTWNDVLLPRWWTPMVGEGQWWWAFALSGGLLFYLIYSKRYGWMSRLIFALFFGFAAGQAFQGFAAYYFPLVRSAINNPLDPPAALSGMASVAFVLNNLLYLVILISVMAYFFFSFEQRGPVARASRLGRYLLMFAFGAIFGQTIMARMSLLIGRIYFLIETWIRQTVFHLPPG